MGDFRTERVKNFEGWCLGGGKMHGQTALVKFTRWRGCMNKFSCLIKS